MLGLPAQLATELGRVDRVATVVAGAVAHPVEGVLRPAHGAQDLAKDVDVVLLAVGADEVGLADATAGKDGPDGRGVVLSVDPVADVLPVAVELGPDAAEDVGHLARDELLHVLVGTIVVRAVGDGGADAVGAVPGAHQHVGAGLGRRVGRGRPVRRRLRDPLGTLERQVAKDLVGRDVVKPHVVASARLQQAVRTLHVRPHERRRVGNGAVVVALRREVHHRVVPRHQPVEKNGVADVSHRQLNAPLRKARKVLRVAGVGQLVEHGHAHVRLVLDHPPHEVRAHEPAPAGDDDALGIEDFSHT